VVIVNKTCGSAVLRGADIFAVSKNFSLKILQCENPHIHMLQVERNLLIHSLPDE